MQKSLSNLKCWIITEGMAGTENQCLGISDALGFAPEIKRISLKQPWKALSPYLRLEQSWSFSPGLEPPWPDLLITSGRKALAAARYIKEQSRGQTLTVHVQDPRVPALEIDILAVPSHDPAMGSNVLHTIAAPNRIARAKLKVEKVNFPYFANLPEPRIAVLIGGTSKAYTMTRTVTETLAKQLQTLNGGLMITTSRRTGAENEKILRDTLAGDKNFIWDGAGKNPYFAMLGWADAILVTADSVSMLSDACTTGKPVYMIPMDGGHPRIDALHKNLIDYGALRVFDGTLETWSYEPLNDAATIADEIRKQITSNEKQ